MKKVNSIWKNLNKPIFALAPMEDVTDTVFRQIIDSRGPADLYFTEFTNVDALTSHGREDAMRRLRKDNENAPIIAQIWGNDPKKYYQVANQIKKLDFDGIDINIGCPQKKIVKQNACSALIKNHALVRELVSSLREADTGLPISIKTRLGFSEQEEMTDWISFLLNLKLDGLTVHLRTVKEMSDVPAHWERMTDVVDLRNKISKDTVILGNGDVQDRKQGLELINKYKCDGVMIGRGVFHNIFAFTNDGKSMQDLSYQDKLHLMKEHIRLFKRTWGSRKKYDILKKYYKIYLSGFEGASNTREEFMRTKTYEEALELINTILKQ